MELDDKAEWANPSANARIRDQARGLASALSNSVALRGLVCVVAGMVVLLLPSATTTLVQFIVIVLLAFAGLTDLYYAVTGRRWFGKRISRWLAAPRGLVATGFAALLGLMAYAGIGQLSLRLVVAVMGIYLGIRGLVVIISALLRRKERDPLPGLAGGTIAVVVGVLAYAVPSSISNTIIISAATVSLLVGFVLISWSVRRASRGVGLDPATASIPEVLWDWIEGSDIGRKERAEQSKGLYFERPDRLSKLGTWWVMLVLSVAIATFAVLADSTAVVIGAMLVAPLMIPILGLAGALVNGWRRRTFQSAIMVLSGATVAICLSYGIAAWAPVAVSFSTNSQILSRVTPNTLDMLIALAAGAAGAFATVNSRVASGIVGVAIAVALVPPLTVVGISLHAGRFDDAGGALLLFLTNFVAIVLAASAVFVISGFARPYVLRNRPRQILLTVAPFIALAGLILLPLTIRSEGLLTSDTRERDAQRTVEAWLGESSAFIVTDVSFADGSVSVSITGPGDAPSASALRDKLEEDLQQPVGLELTVTPVEVTTIAPPAG